MSFHFLIDGHDSRAHFQPITDIILTSLCCSVWLVVTLPGSSPPNTRCYSYVSATFFFPACSTTTRSTPRTSSSSSMFGPMSLISSQLLSMIVIHNTINRCLGQSSTRFSRCEASVLHLRLPTSTRTHVRLAGWIVRTLLKLGNIAVFTGSPKVSKLETRLPNVDSCIGILIT